MTVLKTRLIKENAPDIIGIGGDVNFSSFIDSDMLMDISDFEGLSDIKQSYLDIAKNLEYVPEDGVYSVPYVANAAGILYNKDMFEEHGWTIPTNWSELIELCETIQAAGIQPFYFGFKDTWTCLAPWNSLAVDLADADVCRQVNAGTTTFTKEYKEVAEKMLELLPYGPSDPYAYGYNDACTAFANGESAMYPIGSYAVPQIQSVNPDMNIDSFVTPGNDDSSKQLLNSGIDLQFCVMNSCENKEAAYEVLRYLMEDETIQIYLDDQSAVPCKQGDFTLPSCLDGMLEYINNDKMSDYQDHYYPSEMSVDAQIQTFLMDGSVDKFLSKFDSDWTRYNRDIIRKVQEYEEKGGNN
jgi:raffinose/stachyose/melibiose transport system substrate-binding protein